MPSLRDYRDSIKSVKSTKKITSAMKMVAASKLRKAQEKAEASQPYAKSMQNMISRVAANVNLGEVDLPLLAGTGSDKRHLLVLVTADRGLCGGFNANLIREARKMILDLRSRDKDVSLICIGSKGYDLIKRFYDPIIWADFKGVVGRRDMGYADADHITRYILEQFEDGHFDVCTLVYNKFRSILVQEPGTQQLIPFKIPESEAPPEAGNDNAPRALSLYEYEPDEMSILQALLPKNIGIQLFRALLDSSAGEQAARMTAMDNATRNASEMIDDLTLDYNRARQAYITKELIEIISGAEAL